MSRLPNLNGDFNVWGGVLNDYLSQSLNADGTLKTATTLSKVVEYFIDGAVISGTGNKRLVMPGNGTFVKAVASLNVTPSGIPVIIDVLKNGTTIFTTQANRPTITVGNNISQFCVPDVTAFSTGDQFRVDVTQTGTGPGGSELTVSLYITYS